MAINPQELAQDAVCQSRTGHMTGLSFLPTRPLRLNTNEEETCTVISLYRKTNQMHQCVSKQTAVSDKWLLLYVQF